MAGKWTTAGWPHKGWEYEDTHDLGGLDGECEYCGTSIRYEHFLNHPSGLSTTVGVECATKLTDQYKGVFSEGRKRAEANVRKYKKFKKDFYLTKNYNFYNPKVRATIFQVEGKWNWVKDDRKGNHFVSHIEYAYRKLFNHLYPHIVLKLPH